MTGCRQRWRPLCSQQRSPRRAPHLHCCHLICGGINGKREGEWGCGSAPVSTPSWRAARCSLAKGRTIPARDEVRGGGCSVLWSHAIPASSGQSHQKDAACHQDTDSSVAGGNSDGSHFSAQNQNKAKHFKTSYAMKMPLWFCWNHRTVWVWRNLQCWNSSIFLSAYSFPIIIISI